MANKIDGFILAIEALEAGGFDFEIQIYNVRPSDDWTDDDDDDDGGQNEFPKVSVIDKHAMRFETGKDEKDKPILDIYPNSSKEDQGRRVIANEGQAIEVYPEIVISTGRERWFKTVRFVGENGEPLYVDYDKVIPA